VRLRAHAHAHGERCTGGDPFGFGLGQLALGFEPFSTRLGTTERHTCPSGNGIHDRAVSG
jgi:hypothetical protein